MTRLVWHVALLGTALACRSTPSREDAARSQSREVSGSRSMRLCARPTRGIVVGLDSIAGLSTHATLGVLRHQCSAGDSALYDAVGWQAVAWTFPFAGANVMAVQSKHGYGEVVQDDEVPDLWTVEGDSTRLPDGDLMPRTLGALRARYGSLLVDENIGGDDVDGPHARTCRFPYLLFALSVNDTARHVPDSARVTRVDMDGASNGMAQYCAAHKPIDDR